MKICAMSDLHGYLPKIEKCDLVLICGDSVDLSSQINPYKCKQWYITKFKHWCDNLPCYKVLFIPGNHEVGMEGHEDEYKKIFTHLSKTTLLINDQYVYTHDDGMVYTIFGTPYCTIFYNWAYNKPNNILKEKFSEIPNNIEILITHDAPFGVSDVLLQDGYYTGKHLGNGPLKDAILEKKPNLVFHGHLHSTSREFELLGDSQVINCSIKDENYKPIYKPIYYEF